MNQVKEEGQKGPRNSTMELLRTLAMFLVLVVHANTAFAPWPIGQEEVMAAPGQCFFRFMIESLAIVCVNAFILLSGWFGIKFSFKRLLSFVFQVLFFTLVLSFLPTGGGFSAKSLVDIFTLNHYWFVKAYIILFILSPALNSFAENAPKKLFRDVLIAFFVFQTIFSYISRSVWYEDGYSPLPFIGLYLLSRYIRLHQPAFARLKIKTDIGIYLLLSVSIAALSLVLYKFLGRGGGMFANTNPLVIVSSMYFVLIFTKLPPKQNKVINWIAGSSVGAYLLHMHPAVFQPLFITSLRAIPEYATPIVCILSFALIASVFALGVLLDKIRLLIWKGLQRIPLPNNQ